MRTHGALRNCERCSVVAFNEEQMRNHQDQHVISVGKQQSVYVCSKCVATYSTVRFGSIDFAERLIVYDSKFGKFSFDQMNGFTE